MQFAASCETLCLREVVKTFSANKVNITFYATMAQGLSNLINKGRFRAVSRLRHNECNLKTKKDHKLKHKIDK